MRTANRTLTARTGNAKERVLTLTGQVGALAARSARETGRLAAQLRAGARGRGAQNKLAAARRLEVVAARSEKVVEQIIKRLAGEKISDRLVSMADWCRRRSDPWA